MSAKIADRPVLSILPESEWLAARRVHFERVRRWTDQHRARASRGEKHPIYDFLWDYYSQRPSLLERWHPGVGVALVGDKAREFLASPGYVQTSTGVTADTSALTPRRIESIRWITSLLHACAERPPFFACFGLHEWAMVYRADETRYPKTPLRFSSNELARIVDSMPVRCSHYDAFRFFTPPARPLNRVQPQGETRIELEQRGCVHVTMDLYKWSYKLTPFTPSELMADCFELALAARELDMRASPYDLRPFGFEPVKIETPEGRADYEREQRALALRAEPLRARLIEVCERTVRASPDVARQDPAPDA